MSVMLDTTLGEIVVDLYVDRAPMASTNFLKLCKIKYYNYAPIESIQKNFIIEINGKPGSSGGGSSIWGVVNGDKRRYFAPEISTRMKHNRRGLVSFATQSTNLEGVPAAGSRFFITLSDSHLEYLDGKHSIFGKVAEGMDILEEYNRVLCDMDGKPYKDLRIKHTYILDDPFEDITGMQVPSRSPSPSEDVLKTVRLKEGEEKGEEKDESKLKELKRAEDAESRKLTLEMVGDLPFAEIKPPENVLFVCKLNSITTDEDLETIFSRFGKILSCEIVRDFKMGDSLCYAFIEFDDKKACEEAYFKMENVLIDGNRIHVDFSQSVAKLHINFLERKNVHPPGETRHPDRHRSHTSSNHYRSDRPAHRDRTSSSGHLSESYAPSSPRRSLGYSPSGHKHRRERTPRDSHRHRSTHYTRSPPSPKAKRHHQRYRVSRGPSLSPK